MVAHVARHPIHHGSPHSQGAPCPQRVPCPWGALHSHGAPSPQDTPYLRVPHAPRAPHLSRTPNILGLSTLLQGAPRLWDGSCPQDTPCPWVPCTSMVAHLPWWPVSHGGPDPVVARVPRTTRTSGFPTTPGYPTCPGCPTRLRSPPVPPSCPQALTWAWHWARGGISMRRKARVPPCGGWQPMPGVWPSISCTRWAL